MRNLCRAEFTRLFHNKLFIIFIILFLVGSIAYTLMRCLSYIEQPDLYASPLTPDNVVFGPIIYASFASAALGGMFLSPEYSEGGIRKKLIAGHSRASVYMSDFTVITCASFILIGACCIGTLPSAAILGGFARENSEIIIRILMTFLLTAAFCALYTLICVLCANKAASLLICVCVWLFLIFFGAILINNLDEPEYIEDYTVTEAGEFISLGEVLNPYYVSEPVRSVYGFLVDFLPGSQIMLCILGEITRPLLMLLGNICVIAASIAAGLFAFGKKNVQ